MRQHIPVVWALGVRPENMLNPHDDYFEFPVFHHVTEYILQLFDTRDWHSPSKMPEWNNLVCHK
jgi:hypothetical protein